MNAADHIQSPRQHGLFHHHGINLGDGTVAHYLEGNEIIRSSIYDFSKGGKISVIFHKESSSKSVTLRRAISRIGEKKYNLLFNNCEHFANWCKTGFHKSAQLDNLIQICSSNAIQIFRFLPVSLLTTLQSILKKGIINEKNKKDALEILRKLEIVQVELRNKLEITLRDINNKYQPVKSGKKNTEGLNLLIQGQTIADKLSAVELMIVKMHRQLNKHTGKSY